MHFLGTTLLVFALLIPYSKAKFACYSRCFLTSYFCIPVPYNKKLPHVQGQGQRQEELPRVRGRGGGQEELPHAPRPKAKGSGWEEQPHVQGAVAAWAQEGLEELSHIEGQEGRW